MGYPLRRKLAGSWCLVVLCSCALLGQDRSAEKAPMFSLKTLRGETINLDQHLGKGPIVINFWATWCASCILEMKSMKKVYAAYAPSGMQMFSLSVDDNKTESQIPGVIRTYKLPYTILLDGKKDVCKAFHVSNVPQLFVLDAQGNIVYTHQGFQKGDEKKVEKIIAALLSQER
ncbi:MAG: TlpA family protein disulfide reductase [Chitinispirillaceae bacterium]|nr:TlpA family protein disulfide reductase [Chitinispirillaceae bacterium]